MTDKEITRYIKKVSEKIIEAERIRMKPLMDALRNASGGE
jgi:hypothetical protein